jgi:hypothetical protein
MGRKGMSKEDKLTTILNIYNTRCQPFNLKEIEKEGSAAGVVSQAIKDINKELVDDSLVQSDKIGSGVFFWSFPSAALHQRNMALSRVESSLNKRKARLEQVVEGIKEAEVSRSGGGREEKIRRLNELTELENRLNSELEANKLNDPEQVELIDKQAKNCLESANRWVDNTWAVKSFLTKKKGLGSKEADKYLGIKDDFDYLDENAYLKAK